MVVISRRRSNEKNKRGWGEGFSGRRRERFSGRPGGAIGGIGDARHRRLLPHRAAALSPPPLSNRAGAGRRRQRRAEAGTVFCRRLCAASGEGRVAGAVAGVSAAALAAAGRERRRRRADVSAAGGADARSVAGPLARPAAGRLRRDTAEPRDGYAVTLGRAAVRFLSAAPEANARGQTADLLLVANEAQDILPDVWDAVFDPMAASTNATTLFLGTVWSRETLLARQMAFLREEEQRDGIHRVWTVPWQEVARRSPRLWRAGARAHRPVRPDAPLHPHRVQPAGAGWRGRSLPARPDRRHAGGSSPPLHGRTWQSLCPSPRRRRRGRGRRRPRRFPRRHPPRQHGGDGR